MKELVHCLRCHRLTKNLITLKKYKKKYSIDSNYFVKNDADIII